MVVMDNKGEAEEPPILPAKESTEGPPSYDSATSAPQLPRTRASSSASNSSRCDRINHSSHPKPPNIPTSNLVTIKRKNAYIKGTYVIDAALHVPIEVLTGEGTSATGASAESIPVPRKNLYLETSHGSISADVWLVGGESDDAPEGRTEVEMRTKSGHVTAKLTSVTSRPFALTVSAGNGSAFVSLPSDFVGPVTITAANSLVSLSKVMETRLVTLSEIDGKRVCFIGDFRKANYTGRQTWNGSTVDIECLRRWWVKLSFTDEDKKDAGGSGFLKKIFRK